MMLKAAVLAGIFVPIVICFCIAAVILFVLGCAMYVYIIKFRELVQRTYRKVRDTIPNMPSLY
jgi:CHASE3 domain sensor protein